MVVGEDKGKDITKEEEEKEEEGGGGGREEEEGGEGRGEKRRRRRNKRKRRKREVGLGTLSENYKSAKSKSANSNFELLTRISPSWVFILFI